jgi:hypothetical protein
MKTLSIASGILALAFCSCTQYTYKASYKLGEPYPSAKAKIDRYYDGQEKSFNLFQDQVRLSRREAVPGSRTDYSLTKWAPDIGSQLLHGSTLAKAGDAGSTFEVTAEPIYQWGSSTESRVKDIDEWVVANLKVRHREAGEQRPPEANAAR